jgi:hypothetical protein
LTKLPNRHHLHHFHIEDEGKAELQTKASNASNHVNLVWNRLLAMSDLRGDRLHTVEDSVDWVSEAVRRISISLEKGQPISSVNMKDPLSERKACYVFSKAEKIDCLPGIF